MVEQKVEKKKLIKNAYVFKLQNITPDTKNQPNLTLFTLNTDNYYQINSSLDTKHKQLLSTQTIITNSTQPYFVNQVHPKLKHKFSQIFKIKNLTLKHIQTMRDPMGIPSP